MAKTAFSDTWLRSLEPPATGQVAFWDERLPSFGVRISQGGSKTFVLNRRNNLITIGRFGVLSLAKARAEAKKLLAEFTLGKIRPQSITYAQAVHVFLEDKGKNRRARTIHEYKRLLDRLAFQGQLADISHGEVVRRLSKIIKRQEHNHALTALKVFFNWCIKRKYLTENPVSGLSTHSTVSRARVLTDDEITRVWLATEQTATFNSIVRLLLLTGQRRTEIASLQSSWIQNDTITLPSELTKNGREHAFPFGELARSILHVHGSPKQDSFLFPARGRNAPFNGWSKCKAALDTASGVKDWTLHDLRRTFASNLAALGVQLPVIEKLLNHVSGSFGGIVGTYQRHSYMPEMRAAIEAWEARLTAILR
jgi:integrase